MKSFAFIVSISIITSFVVGVLIGPYMFHTTHDHDHHSAMEMNSNEMSVHAYRDTHMAVSASIKGTLLAEGEYACCLEKPCTYCIAKTPGHGEGASCHCLDDVMNGVHPCGECIGEILEGHGNPFLAEYFATAIAEKVGLQHLDSLKAIISDIYDISVDEQV